MIKVCIIVPKMLPLPSVKGGAIETLMTDIIRYNEKARKLDITAVSIYDEKAWEESKKYKYTKFIYIKNNIKYKIKALLVRIKNAFGNKFNTYNEVVLDKIKYEKYDYIVVEDGAYFSFRSYLKHFDKEQMILHFHHSEKSDKETDATFSTFIGVSDFVVNHFAEASTIEDTRTLKNGINLEKFNKKISTKERIEIRKKVGLNVDDFVVIFCGRLIKEKGVLELVKAVKSINNPKIKLMIVGSINFGQNQTSEYLTCLNEEIKNSEGRVVATGFIGNWDLYKYYQSADVAVMPSLWEDAALLVNIEAMLSGIPTIITKTGGACEYMSKETIVIPKDDKVVENIADKIIYLLENKDKREKMIKEGLKVAKKYSTEQFYEDFVKILENKKKGKK